MNLNWQVFNPFTNLYAYFQAIFSKNYSYYFKDYLLTDGQEVTVNEAQYTTVAMDGGGLEGDVGSGDRNPTGEHS